MSPIGTNDTHGISVYRMPDGTQVDAAQAAELASEGLRALAHLTGWSAAGLTYPSDVHAILGTLSTAIARLPQSLEQIQTFLTRQHAAGHLEADYGPYAGHTEQALADVIDALTHAVASIDSVRYRLDIAQRATSGLSYTGPDTAADA